MHSLQVFYPNSRFHTGRGKGKDPLTQKVPYPRPLSQVPPSLDQICSYGQEKWVCPGQKEKLTTFPSPTNETLQFVADDTIDESYGVAVVFHEEEDEDAGVDRRGKNTAVAYDDDDVQADDDDEGMEADYDEVLKTAVSENKKNLFNSFLCRNNKTTTTALIECLFSFSETRMLVEEVRRTKLSLAQWMLTGCREN